MVQGGSWKFQVISLYSSSKNIITIFTHLFIETNSLDLLEFQVDISFLCSIKKQESGKCPKILHPSQKTPNELKMLVTQSCSTLCKLRLQPIRLLCSSNFPGKNTGVCCHFLLQGIFPTQGSNPGLLHCKQILYRLSHLGSPTLNGNYQLINQHYKLQRELLNIHSNEKGNIITTATE